MNQEEVIRLDQEAKKEMDEFRSQFNFIYRRKDKKHFLSKDESVVYFMKNYIERHYKRRYPERFE